MRRVPLKMFYMLTYSQGTHHGVVVEASMWLKWGAGVSKVHVGRQRV